MAENSEEHNERKKERKRTGNFKGDKSCQVKCGRKEGKKYPDTSSLNRKGTPHRSKSVSVQSKAQALYLQLQRTEMAQCFAVSYSLVWRTELYFKTFHDRFPL